MLYRNYILSKKFALTDELLLNNLKKYLLSRVKFGHAHSTTAFLNKISFKNVF